MMQPFILISILVFALIVVGALIVVATALRKSNADITTGNQELHPRGYWVSLGISIGAGFGVALGLVFDNLALGIAIGAAIGVSIGGALEQKNKGELRPFSEQEQKVQKWGVALGLLMLLLFAGIFVLILVSRSG
jgi:heme/copper-type cytochrome/quinol oxidase subunit 2